MKSRTRVFLPFTLLTLAAMAAGPLSAQSQSSGGFSVPLKMETLSTPAGVAARTFDRMELRRLADGTYAVALLPEDKTLALPPVDLRLLTPRLPSDARGSKELSTIALIQREFNRNEVHNDVAGNLDFSIANNCLKEGLWEVKLAEKKDGKVIPVFHAWLDFPKTEYARLLDSVSGMPDADAEPLVASYPKLAGLPVPLEKLRRVVSESPLPPLDLHLSEPLGRLPEQQGKAKLILTPGIATYGDFSSPARQPVVTARFSEPGFYNPDDPMKFDLSWLAHPVKAVARKATRPSGGQPFTEIELDFENGNRILFADSRIAALAPRSEAPTAENDVLKIVSGIGTPGIHATAAERTKELDEDRPRYLFLLDGKGNLADNHFGGVDGIYLWRDAGNLHIWVCGYERIAFFAHYSTPWKF
jgi:hypothetical protein